MSLRPLFAASLIGLALAPVPASSAPSPLGLATASQAASQSASMPSPTEAFVSLDGTWTGTLTYRDYQSKKLETISVEVTMEALPDGETMVQRYAYQDPQFKVYVTNLVALRDGLVSGAAARAGRAFETYEKRITIKQAEDIENWTAILMSEGYDDNRPAAIRETMTRSGSELVVTKEFDFLDDEETSWEYRNEIRLKRS